MASGPWHAVARVDIASHLGMPYGIGYLSSTRRIFAPGLAREHQNRISGRMQRLRLRINLLQVLRFFRILCMSTYLALWTLILYFRMRRRSPTHVYPKHVVPQDNLQLISSK